MAGSPTFFAQFRRIGAKITTTGVLFRNAENELMTGNTRSCARDTLDSLPGNSFFRMEDNAPLWRMPSLTRKSNATVIIPRLLKPATICLGEIMPATMNSTTKDSSTMPGRILSIIRATNMPTSPSKTKMISKFMFQHHIYYRSTPATRDKSSRLATMNQGFSKSSLL